MPYFPFRVPDFKEAICSRTIHLIKYLELEDYESGRQVTVNFRFDQHDIEQYDEIWLFGYNGELDELVLSPQELNALHQWMDNGGGILAMGDHEDLGAAICKDIKRVRDMRYWRKSDTPSRTGPDRHDTNRPTAEDDGSEEIPFQNQSNNELQPLYCITRHPILEDYNGRLLNLFPKHPHEGWVYDNYNHISNQSEDFPGGVKPETIAFVQSQPIETEGKDGQAQLKMFGALGVYDGFAQGEGVGRIVVDSTWHHWFNINLIGMKNAADQTNYNRYRIFVSNVACWLAPKQVQKQMYLRAIWHSQFTTKVMENYDTTDYSWTYKDTQKILKTFVSELFRKEWLSLWYPKELLSPEKESRDGLLDAWSPYKCPHWELLEAELLQGVIKEWRPLILEIIGNKRTSVEEQELTERFETGARQGVWNAMNRWSEVIDKQREMKENYAAKLSSPVW